MGSLSNLIGGSSVSGAEPVDGASTVMVCAFCDRDLGENEVEDGYCEECSSSEYSGTKYCCGGIYEEGEDTCRSCGEPL